VGEHTTAVLGELGLSAGELAALADEGVIGRAVP
jgi:crotonobetainyl-CoA:carnitine CoA-transferase CaiB-like acyl-CoA transferase